MRNILLQKTCNKIEGIYIISEKSDFMDHRAVIRHQYYPCGYSPQSKVIYKKKKGILSFISMRITFVYINVK